MYGYKYQALQSLENMCRSWKAAIKNEHNTPYNLPARGGMALSGQARGGDAAAYHVLDTC